MRFLPECNPAFQHVITIYPMENVPEVLSDNEYIGIRPEQLNTLYRTEWKRLLDRMVILQPVTFNRKKEYNLHRVLRAIDYNTLISKLQPQQYCTPDEVIKPLPVLLKSYEHYPEIVTNTQSVIDACSFDFDFSTPKNKKYYTDSKANDLELLTRLTYEGLKKNMILTISQPYKELKRNSK